MQSMTKGGVHATATRRCQMKDRVKAGAGAPSSRLARQTNDEAHDRQVRAPECMLPRLLTLLLPPHLRSPLLKRARSAGCGFSATSASAEKLREASTVRAVEASSLQSVSARCTATSNGDGARGVDTARDATKAPFSPRMPRSCAGEKAVSLKFEAALLFAQRLGPIDPQALALVCTVTMVGNARPLDLRSAFVSACNSACNLSPMQAFHQPYSIAVSSFC